jgi:hypothetical protein
MKTIANVFLTRCFAPSETIALLLRRGSAASTLQRIVPLERALAPRYLGCLYMQEIPESVQATVNSINRELRKSGSEKTSRTTPKRKSATAVFLGKRSSKSAMSEGVFEILTPNDTKRSEREVAGFR